MVKPITVFRLAIMLTLTLVAGSCARTIGLNKTVGIADSGWNVRLSRSGETLGSFDVPKGVSLAMRYSDKEPHSFDFDRKRLEFHGRVELHAHTTTEADNWRFNPSEPDLQQALKGGLVLQADGVDLVIEPAHRQ